jgi:hypothetical protein
MAVVILFSADALAAEKACVVAYMCEADAQTAGNRAAKNERHP